MEKAKFFQQGVAKAEAQKGTSGVYDELSGEWSGVEAVEYGGKIEMNKIPRFVSDVLSQIARLNNFYDIDKVAFRLNVGGQKIEFVVKSKREDEQLII